MPHRGRAATTESPCARSCRRESKPLNSSQSADAVIPPDAALHVRGPNRREPPEPERPHRPAALMDEHRARLEPDADGPWRAAAAESTSSNGAGWNLVHAADRVERGCVDDLGRRPRADRYPSPPRRRTHPDRARDTRCVGLIARPPRVDQQQVHCGAAERRQAPDVEPLCGERSGSTRPARPAPIDRRLRANAAASASIASLEATVSGLRSSTIGLGGAGRRGLAPGAIHAAANPRSRLIGPASPSGNSRATALGAPDPPRRCRRR